MNINDFPDGASIRSLKVMVEDYEISLDAQMNTSLNLLSDLFMRECVDGVIQNDEKIKSLIAEWLEISEDYSKFKLLSGLIKLIPDNHEIGQYADAIVQLFGEEC